MMFMPKPLPFWGLEDRKRSLREKRLRAEAARQQASPPSGEPIVENEDHKAAEPPQATAAAR